MVIERAYRNIGSIRNLFDRDIIKASFAKHRVRNIKNSIFCLYGLKLTLITSDVQTNNSSYKDTYWICIFSNGLLLLILSYFLI